jgi:hypothetical protein
MDSVGELPVHTPHPIRIACAAMLITAPVSVNTGGDLSSRFVWRGWDIANTPAMQPAVAVGWGNLEFGSWGAYTLSNESSASDEIDFWLSYTVSLNNGTSVMALATDYYFPDAGIDLFNFNNHDAMIDDTIPDPGAHTLELGLSVTGPTSFPITVAGYINVYNDAGSNTYFQLDYPFTVGETQLGVFCGAAGGSKDNPDYYGAESLNAINVGVTAARELKVSSSFSLPLTMSLIVNPRQEIAHIVVGLSF